MTHNFELIRWDRERVMIYWLPQSSASAAGIGWRGRRPLAGKREGDTSSPEQERCGQEVAWRKALCRHDQANARSKPSFFAASR
jgi:hypothetical protein